MCKMLSPFLFFNIGKRERKKKENVVIICVYGTFASVIISKQEM